MNKFDTFIDIHKYIRKLSVKRHYLSKAGERNFISYQPNAHTSTGLRNASMFNPPLASNSKVGIFRDLVLQELEAKKIWCQPQGDLLRGVRSLCDNKDLVIRPADKGGGIVLLKKADYINEMNLLL